jgi:O-antigen/teichoic acid export membrane protein
MSKIRRQSIISSVVVYIGFAFGLINTYLFAREGGFTKEQYGLTGIFIAVSNIFFSLSQLGMTAYVYKFYPYYKDNLSKKKNDLLSIALIVSLTGYCLVIIAGILLKDLVIRKFGANAHDLVIYYKWIFPFGLGLTLFSILEAYAWQLKRSVFTNFLKEILFRVLTTILIMLSFTGIIKDFDLFIKLYSFTYLTIALTLVIYLISHSQFHLTFSLSIVSKKYFKKILSLCSFVYGGALVFTLSSVFDTLVIASVIGIDMAAVYTLAQNMASLVQAPQRGIISSSLGSLSQAWKDKNMHLIDKIYHRSSINQLIFSTAMFALIWLNFTDAVYTFHLNKDYLVAINVFLFIGLTRIVDMGTGVSGQIIATSTKWRFDFFTGIFLLLITLPLNYILTYQIGVTGPAIANLISFSIYNGIRYWFLYKKFDLQPFTKQSAYTILLAIVTFVITYFLFNDRQGIEWLFIRSITFFVLFISGTIAMKLSPDIIPVLQSIKKRLRLNRQ